MVLDESCTSVIRFFYERASGISVTPMRIHSDVRLLSKRILSNKLVESAKYNHENNSLLTKKASLTTLKLLLFSIVNEK